MQFRTQINIYIYIFVHGDLLFVKKKFKIEIERINSEICDVSNYQLGRISIPLHKLGTTKYT